MTLISSRKSLHFSRNVGAGASGESKYDVRHDATVEEVLTRFYPGQELDLHVELYLEKADSGNRIPLVELAGNKGYIAGDDDRFRFNPTVSIEKEDTLVIVYDNNDATNAYDYTINIDLDRVGGVKRSILAILDRVL